MSISGGCRPIKSRTGLKNLHNSLVWIAALLLLSLWSFPAKADTASLPLSPHQTSTSGSDKAPPVPAGFRPLTLDQFFACEVPADWDMADHSIGLTAEEKRVYGVTLQGPWHGDVPVKIYIHYYADGNLLYRSLDHYLKLFSKPALGVALEGSSYGAVTSTILSGRAGKVFERRKNEYVPLHNRLGDSDEPESKGTRIFEKAEMMSKAVPVKERFIVLPAKNGFYALRYSASAENFQEFIQFFEKVTTSFVAKK